MAVKIARNSSTQEWKDAKILIAGESGVGKTTFAAQDENPLFICFEKGLASLPVDFVEAKDHVELEAIREHLIGLIKEKKFPYTSIVLDGLDDLVPLIDGMILAWAHSKFKKEVMDNVQGIGDIPNGNGWVRRLIYAKHWLNMFSQFPCALILLSHTKQKTMGNGANSFQKIVLNAPHEGMGNSIKGFMDHLVVARTTVRGNQKTVYLNASDRMDCIGKSRGSEGKNPKPLVPDGIIWKQGPEAPRENFENFRKLFN